MAKQHQTSIETLAEQARKHFPQTETSGEYWVLDEQKFGELIVRECIKVIEPTNHHRAFAQGYLAGPNGVVLLDKRVMALKKQFNLDQE